MNKNAYEIRLDVLISAHTYCMSLFEEKAAALQLKANDQKTNVTLEDIEKIYPTKRDILDTAEMFYEFVSNSHK
jgi:hypothetical protein